VQESEAVNALLADSPAVVSPEQTSAQHPPGADQEGPPTSERTCANCGSPLNPGQDWCLQCGAGTPESLTTHTPSWRSAAAIVGLAAILAIGAATAAYAALSKSAGKARPVVTTVAQATLPTTTAVTPTTTTPVIPTTPGGSIPVTPKIPGTPTTVNPLLPTGSAKPPKIPLTAPTPKSSGTTTTPSSPSGGETTPSTTPTKSTGESTPATAPPQTSILLDTDAASTYNPYGYPTSSFGDPSLAIDGEAATGWTAQVEPTVAPKMAEGLTIDLKSPRRLSALALVTSTPGMTVQVYGANGSALPTSITDPAWVPLSPYFLEKKKRERIKLRHSAKAFRFVALWISSAPAASVGTPQAPGHVSVDELELFPAKA
jgi:hypothetical protein